MRLVRTPKYMHTFVFEHPIFAFDDVRVGADRVLGEVGRRLRDDARSGSSRSA